MLSKPKRLLTLAILLVIPSSFAWSIEPAAACEVFVPPNFLYEEHYDFEESRLPPDLSLNFARPEWVEAEGLVGFLQLVNSSPDDIYLLYASALEVSAGTLSDGQKVDSSIWSRGLVLRPGDTLDILGEGHLMQFAPGLHSSNINNTDGKAQPPELDPLPTQGGKLYFVVNQRLYIVPFTVIYSNNPAYKPEGTFLPYTLAQKVESAPIIVLGVALQEAGYDANAATIVQVEQWLKGRGDGEIIVTGFGGTSCDYQIEAGARRIFFLMPDGDSYTLHGFQAGMFDAMTWPADADDITDILGQALPEEVTESSPVKVAWPWSVGGLALILFIFGGAYSWRRHRVGHRA